MRPEDLIDAIGQVDEDLIEDTEKNKKSGGWKRKTVLCILAACVLGVALFLFFWPWDDKVSLSGETGGTYRDYYGPVFPLSMAEENENILASRQIDYDFSYYAEKSSIFSSEQPLPFASVYRPATVSPK